MKKKNKWNNHIRRNLLRTLFLFCGLLFIWSVPVNATAQEGQEVSNLPHLMQAMSEEDEYLGLLKLGMLETKELTIQDSKTAAKQVENSVLRIDVGGYCGSSVIVHMEKDFLILATAKHLLVNGVTAKVMFPSGAYSDGIIVGYSDQYDVGFVKVMTQDILIQDIRKIKYVSINTTMQEQLQIGSTIFLLGTEGGTKWNYYEGAVTNPWEFFPEFNSFMIHNYCFGKPGMSGGGTFDAFGNYIGMISGGLGEETASLPASIVEEAYKQMESQMEVVIKTNP